MEDKERRMISFQVSAEEAKALDARAKQAGLSRSDYLRDLIFNRSTSSTTDLEELIKHAIYVTNQVHSAVFSIAESQGRAGRFLSTEELLEVINRVEADALRYAAEFPARFAARQMKWLAANRETA
jgi:hypothetical protein